MSGENKALAIVIVAGLIMAFGIGHHFGYAAHCDCPEPEVKRCKLDLPERN